MAIQRSFRTPAGDLMGYVEHGDGPPIVLLHGWQSSSLTWAPVAQRLAGRFRVIALDMRGSGASAGITGPWTMHDFATDLEALRAHLTLDWLVLVGHSFGAAVAVRYALDHRRHLAGLITVAGLPPGGVEHDAATLEAFNATIGAPERMAAAFEPMEGADDPAAALRLIRDAAATVPRSTAEVTWQLVRSVDFADEASRLQVPALVLAADEDAPMPVALQQRDLADVIGGRLEVIRAASHFPQLQQPDQVATLIGEFAAERLMAPRPAPDARRVTVHDWLRIARQRIRSVSVDELRERVERCDALVLDVRDLHERWRHGTVPGSASAPRGMLEFWADTRSEDSPIALELDRPIIVFCADGRRSVLAADTLKRLGFTDVAHLGVGFKGWRDAGAAVEPVSPPLGLITSEVR